jgi:hypothetical protein
VEAAAPLPAPFTAAAGARERFAPGGCRSPRCGAEVAAVRPALGGGCLGWRRARRATLRGRGRGGDHASSWRRRWAARSAWAARCASRLAARRSARVRAGAAGRAGASCARVACAGRPPRRRRRHRGAAATGAGGGRGVGEPRLVGVERAAEHHVAARDDDAPPGVAGRVGDDAREVGGVPAVRLAEHGDAHLAARAAERHPGLAEVAEHGRDRVRGRLLRRDHHGDVDGERAAHHVGEQRVEPLHAARVRRGLVDNDEAVRVVVAALLPPGGRVLPGCAASPWSSTSPRSATTRSSPSSSPLSNAEQRHAHAPSSAPSFPSSNQRSHAGFAA